MKSIFPGILVTSTLVAIICLTPSEFFASVRGEYSGKTTRSVTSKHNRSTPVPESVRATTDEIPNFSATGYRSLFGDEETLDSIATMPSVFPTQPTFAAPTFVPAPALAAALPLFIPANLPQQPAPAAFITNPQNEMHIASTAGAVPKTLTRSGSFMPLTPFPDETALSMAQPASLTDIPGVNDVLQKHLPKTAVANIPLRPITAKQKTIAREPGAFSSTAFASITESVPLNASCPTSVCKDPPPKGITLRGYGRAFTEKQKNGWSNGINSNYETKGKMAGLGYLKDWSIATTLGLSVDYLDAELESKWEGDNRSNQVTGYLFNAHVQTSLMDKFPFEGKFMFGRLNTTGEGQWAPKDSLSNSIGWIEDKHDSTMFGFSGKVGVPLVLGDDIKLAPDLGIRFIRLQSDAYDVRLSDGRTGTVNDINSTSLSVPLTLDLKKEMVQCFGTFTPRITGGIIKEFSDTAMGVRAFNASAASRLRFDSDNDGYLESIDESQRTFYKIGAGADLTTVGGWKVNGDFSYIWHGPGKYKNSIFTLEASRCF